MELTLFPASNGAGTPLTMSSREIAELTGKRHDHVLRDTRKMLAELGNQPPQIWGRYADAKGEQRECAYLPKRETLILVSGYSTELRARIIDRWMELEGVTPQAVDPIRVLNDPAAMRGLLLTYSEKVLALQAENAELAPKADALDRIADAEGSLCVTDAAKTLQTTRNALFRWLRANHWIYRRVGTTHDVGYQSKISAGCLIHKVETYARADGTEGARTQVRITPKGMAALAMAFPPAATAA